MKQTLGIIGLGNAGSSLSVALAKHYRVIGYDTNDERKALLPTSVLEWAPSIEELAQTVNCVLLSLPHPDISRKVIDSLIAASGNTNLVIETSTITPSIARELGTICASSGVTFVEACIVGGLKAMAEGNATFLVGADAEAMVLAKPILDTIAGQIFHLGPLGAGSGAKIVNNAVMHAEMVILLEAAAMAEKMGISTGKLAEILSQPMGLLSPLEHRLNERVLNRDYEHGMSVTNALKDSKLALQTAQQLGVPLFATLAAHTPYEIAENLGFGHFDYAVLAKLWESWCSVEFSE